MKKNSNVLFRLNEFDITYREIIVSVAILFVIFISGKMISDEIVHGNNESIVNMEQYLQINNDNELFKHNIETGYGNIAAYGILEPVDKVGMDDIPSDYLSIKRIEEHYTKHSRNVCTTSGSGKNSKTTCHIEYYWTWDHYDTVYDDSEHIEFMDITLDYDYLNIGLSYKHISTNNFAHNKRYLYYGIEAKQYEGTLITNTANKEIEKDSPLYINKTIDNVLDDMKTMGVLWLMLFWTVWIFLGGILIYGFLCIENKWLES